MIIQGNCLEKMKELGENSVDAIITDPPYGLSFMGKKWDYKVPSVDLWKECLRVMKPGAFLLSFAGTRTYHRMAVNIEDAGFEIRDMISWLYGSGFPKSLNIGKQIDKNVNKTSKELIEFGKLIREYRDMKGISQRELGLRIGASRELINLYEIKGNIQQQFPTKEFWIKIKEELQIPNDKDYIYEEAERKVIGKNDYTIPKELYQVGKEKNGDRDESLITAPATPEAKEWEGWGTALKPACEPIIVARKSLSEKNVALNVLKWGTGGINIDDCRISLEGETQPSGSAKKVFKSNQYTEKKIYGDNKVTPEQGRFPANIILDEEAGRILDEQSGISKSSSGKCEAIITEDNRWKDRKGISTPGHKVIWEGKGDKGGASRFFYCAKASKSERNLGCKELDNKTREERGNNQATRICVDCGLSDNGINSHLKCSGEFEYKQCSSIKNNHPTVKPIKLMEYLIKLVSKEGATVLDPFLGSGTTAIACQKLNRKWIGIEKEEDYIKIAEARLKPFTEQTKLTTQMNY